MFITSHTCQKNWQQEEVFPVGAFINNQNVLQIAKEYLKVQTELAYLAQKLQDLQEEASRCESLQSKIDDQQEVKKLKEEKVSDCLIPIWVKYFQYSKF